jgi:peptidoglycan/xylan/chitin deacetylase (PgdA/CDA1 family)
MGRRTRMSQSTTSPRDPTRPHPASGPAPKPRHWSQAPEHRRRRALALAGLVVALIVLGIAVSGGGGPSTPTLVAHTGGVSFLRTINTLSGTGSQSLRGRELAVQNAAVNRTLGYTSYVWEAGRQHREIALTFDDGPGPYTPRILSILERYDVPATFFEVGSLERFFGASTSQIVAHDWPIGDHTFSHLDLSRLSERDQQSQIVNQTKAIARYGASFPRLFRPPYGSWNSTTISLLHRYHMLMVLWTVDTNDWKLPGVSSIIHTVLAGARPGAIVLMHDAGGNRSETADALPTIIKDLRARGYRLVTVPQLLTDNPAPHDQKGYLLGSGG